MSVRNVLQKIIASPIIYNQYRVRHLSHAVTTGKDLKLASPDLLMTTFKHATSTKNVLETVQQHQNVMNAKHIMQALRTLFILQKEGRSELSTKEIISNKSFEKLCRRLKSLAGVIDTNETIEALKIVTFVGVPEKSTIVQVLLQLLRHNVNDLTLSNIMFLEFLLGHYTSVPLADALKIALPIVFEIQLPVKMNRSCISTLREYLYYATRNRLSEKTVDLILSSMLKCQDISDAKTAKSIIWSLTDLPPSPSFEPLVRKNIDTLLVHLDELSYDDLSTTLSKLSTAYSKECPFFSSTLLCDAVAGHIIDKDIGYKDAVYTMKKFDRLGVMNKYLIDYMATKIQEDPTLYTQDNLYNLYVMMKYLSKTDYRPANWDFLHDVMANMEITKLEDINWLKLAASLCYLQIFNETVLDKCLKEDIENRIRKRFSLLILHLSVYHSIKLYKPQLLKLVPRHWRAKDFIQYLPVPTEFPLQGALYNAFGGENYVNSGSYSKEGIFIDHAIVFRQGGYPVATNFKSTFIEDLETSPENQIVLIMCLTPEVYNENNTLKPASALRVKILEDLGYVTVPVCLNSWSCLPDYEKIPYLVRSIKEKLGVDMMLENNYG